jgi:predicted dehydrogenase
VDQNAIARHPITRRAVLGAGVGAALTAASYARVLGANDRVGVGFIGFGLIGKRHVLDFQAEQDVALVAIAETHRGRLDEAVATMGSQARSYGDFRKLLDDANVDAVVVSTPDHWHALMTMMACAAGKDVYVEKPLTLFAREGRWMIEVARREKRVVGVGTQQRSGAHYQKAREAMRGGEIGRIVSVRAAAFRNIMPGFGAPKDCDPPRELDWEMFVGPSPMRKYNPNRGLYHFRWFWDYSGGQMTNLGQHSLDIVDWTLGVGELSSVCSFGGRLALADNGETPDTQDAVFQFPGWTAVWSHRETSRGSSGQGELTFFGTKGSLTVSRRGWVITPDRQIPPESSVPQFAGEHPAGGPRSTGEGALRSAPLWTRPARDDTGDVRGQFRQHARNFLDCVKSRQQPVSDLESGHRVATMCHLANISLRLGRSLRFDAKQETIAGDAEASKMLERPYRAPWDGVLKSLGIG